MTQDEQDRVDKLISDIADWKIELNTVIVDSIKNHQDHCFAQHIEPINQKLDSLLQAERDRIIESRYRMRWLKYLTGAVAVLAGLVGILVRVIELSH